jgi:ribosomal RNA-processing protein 9
MLGKKRQNKKGKANFKAKSAEEKMGNLKKIHDEEIVSESDEGENNIDNDEFFEPSKNETADEKRLRIAKKLISKIGTEEKEEVNEFLINEIKKEKNEVFTEYADRISPNYLNFYKGHKNTITALEVFDQSAITVGKDCRAIKWDLETGKKILFPQFTKKSLLTCAINDNVAFFAGKDRHVYQYDIHNQKLINSFKAHSDYISSIVYDTAKDQLYTTSADATLKVWALNKKGAIAIETFWGHTDKVNDMDMMSGNRLITCGNDNQINLWKVDSQSFLQFKINELSVTDNIKAFNKDYFLSSTDNGILSLWRTSKKKPIFKLSNSHGITRKVSLNHPFFKNSEQSYDDEFCGLSAPITAIGCIKNSDVIFTGSNDGNLNIYKYSPNDVDKIIVFKNFYLRDGVINSIKTTKNNDYAVVAHGRDNRLGRWDVIEDTKNGISVVKLFE